MLHRSSTGAEAEPQQGKRPLVQMTLLEQAKRFKAWTPAAATGLPDERPSIDARNGWQLRRQRRSDQPASVRDQLAELHAGAARKSPVRVVHRHFFSACDSCLQYEVKPGMLLSDNDWSETGAVSWGRQIQSDFWYVPAQARELQMEMEDVD